MNHASISCNKACSSLASVLGSTKSRLDWLLCFRLNNKQLLPGFRLRASTLLLAGQKRTNRFSKMNKNEI